ncbi:MAG TPA: glutamate formiminotransferase, partial [Actinomycetota bacterium]|nr:glutamate formiminotransferase [Actinomycetota bacterium]
MPLIAVPNVSEGRDHQRIDHFTSVLSAAGVDVLDVHTDAVHHRTVFTITGSDDGLSGAAVGLAAACKESIDLRSHDGRHPRLGGLDVWPFVPHQAPLDDAVVAAHATGKRIADELNLPVYFYGAAARRAEFRELSDLRRGGLDTLIERASTDLPPDEGPTQIDPRHGVVCLGARDVLIAFNVWLDGPVERAEEIAAGIRERRGGLAGVRALGIELDSHRSQVSMNLTDPERGGIEDAFTAI